MRLVALARSLALAVTLVAAGACRPRPGERAGGEDRSGVRALSDRGPAAPPPLAASVLASSSAIGGGPREAAPAGAELVSHAHRVFATVACAGSDTAPMGEAEAKVVRAHCEALRATYETYRKGWLAVAAPALAQLVPKGAPKTVVYPFGGGDLVTALAAYPEATEITTLSLEPEGDVRALDAIAPGKLAAVLALERRALGRLLGATFSSTRDLDVLEHLAVSGELVFTMAALAIHGLEPVSFRYFTLREDGSIRYLETAELTPPARPRDVRDTPFANVEILFRARGDRLARPRVFRHLAVDLSDAHLGTDGRVLAHLRAKGDVSALVKAASHLLWSYAFSQLSRYLVEHAASTFSDSTGVPPRVARAAGLVQETHGTFVGPVHYGAWNPSDGKDLATQFARQPKRPLPFLFGYPDAGGNGHLVITRRPGR
jgi:hypothetical protein